MISVIEKLYLIYVLLILTYRRLSEKTCLLIVTNRQSFMSDTTKFWWRRDTLTVHNVYKVVLYFKNVASGEHTLKSSWRCKKSK